MALYQNYAKELLSKLGRLNQLVTHAPSIGGYHENIVASYLKTFLSLRFSVKTGFVCDPISNEVSPQIDILIVDENFPAAYLFQEDDFVVVTGAAVICAIEIKTNFDGAAFADISKKAAAFKKVNSCPLNNFIALCFTSRVSNINTVSGWFGAVDIKDDWINYPSYLVILDSCCYQSFSDAHASPSGVIRIVCNENSGIDKEEALLTYFLLSVLSFCELKSGGHNKNTIQTVFQGDFNKLFTAKHECFKYGIGHVPLDELKFTNGAAIYKRSS